MGETKTSCQWCTAGLPISSETVMMHVRYVWTGEPRNSKSGKISYPWTRKDLIPCERAFAAPAVRP